MVLFRRCTSLAALLAVAGVSGAYAQVSSINSAFVSPRDVFNSIPAATFTAVTNYPTLISFSEQNVSTSTSGAFANRDLWKFSNDGGATAYQFHNTDYFHASMDLTLTGNPATPRKEAGFIFSTTSGNGDIQFIVDTDAHEIVQFGGISFVNFRAAPFNMPDYTSGTKITLGITYFKASDGNNALIFSANGNNSPIEEFGAGQGIGDGSTLAGYFQISNDATNASNGGSALFENISIAAVPEPSALALMSLGGLSLLLFRRRS